MDIRRIVAGQIGTVRIVRRFIDRHIQRDFIAELLKDDLAVFREFIRENRIGIPAQIFQPGRDVVVQQRDVRRDAVFPAFL